MNIVENMKAYIEEQIAERGFDKDGQIEINFAGLCTEEETMQATKELGYEADNEGCNEGVWWICK